MTNNTRNYLHMFVDIYQPLHARVAVVNGVVPIIVNQQLLSAIVVSTQRVTYLLVGSAGRGGNAHSHLAV